MVRRLKSETAKAHRGFGPSKRALGSGSTVQDRIWILSQDSSDQKAGEQKRASASQGGGLKRRGRRRERKKQKQKQKKTSGDQSDQGSKLSCIHEILHGDAAGGSGTCTSVE